MKDKKDFKLFKTFMLLFVTAALGLSLFLAYEYYQPEPIGCPLSAVSENDCETVRQSPYSSLFGVKLPVWGSMYFGLLFIILTSNIIGILKYKYSNTIIFVLALFGMIFETVMTLVQIFLIKALCKWCLMTETVVVAVFFLSLAVFVVSDFKPILKNLKLKFQK